LLEKFYALSNDSPVCGPHYWIFCLYTGLAQAHNSGTLAMLVRVLGIRKQLCLVNISQKGAT